MLDFWSNFLGSEQQNKAEKDYALVAKDASRPTVSWLKNEPKVSFFPVI